MVGVSTDAQDKVDRFKRELSLPFPMVGDPDGAIVRAYQVRWPVVGWARRVTYVIGGDRRVIVAYHSELHFDEHRANELLIEDGRLTGAVREPILGKDAKLSALHEISKRLGIGLADTLAVGDGANDIPMLQDAGLGVALHAKPRVQEAVSVSINHGDLSALLYLQGYRREEFVEQ